jgi:thioredoxin reductase (NADPH)
MARSVVIYTQPGCLFCDKVKTFLRERGVAFAEKDVIADEQAFDELEAKGFFATPVTVIDGDAVVGFNRTRLEALLGTERRD